MRNRRIAIVANTTWNIYNFRLNVIRQLLSEGHEVIVMAPVDKFISYTEQLPEVIHVPLKHLVRDSVDPAKELLLVNELRSLYRKFKPDLVLHYTIKPNIYGGIAAKLIGIPSIAVVTGLGYSLIHQGWLNTVSRTLYKLSMKYHRFVIFENQDDQILFQKDKLVNEQQSKSIKGCGVDAQFFSPNGNKRDCERITFTFVGRLLYDKGIREFVEAAKEVQKKFPHARFWLVGDIDKENPSAVKNEDLVKWIRHPEIEYHGDTDQIRHIYAQSDCIVLPSYREGMPRVIMEAMSMEKPVITTDTAGCRETVEQGVNGYLVPVKNVTALTDAMARFISLSNDQREKMGKSGREKVLHEFDDKLIAKEIIAYIYQALSGK